jgi:hypothetical protein
MHIELFIQVQRTLKKLSKWQKSKLVRGVGWQGRLAFFNRFRAISWEELTYVS